MTYEEIKKKYSISIRGARKMRRKKSTGIYNTSYGGGCKPVVNEDKTHFIKWKVIFLPKLSELALKEEFALNVFKSTI